MKGYFGTGVTCIYIDQFAASNLFDECPDKLWQEIAELIGEKFEEGKVICPVPPEHFLESSNKTKQRAEQVDQQLHRLAKGLAFLPESAIAASFMISLVREQPLDQHTFCSPLKYQGTLSREGALDGFKAQHADLNAKITEAAAGANEIRELLRDKKFPRKLMEPMYQAIKLMQVRRFQERLADLLVNGHTVSRGVNFANGPVIDWPDLLLQLLLLKHQMTSQEAAKLLMHIDAHGFEQIAPLDIRVSLTANLTVEHKNETVNDQIDFMRLASGMPPADMLFTDKQRKFELTQTGLATKYQADIFSGTRPDLEAFCQRLNLL